MNTASHSKVGIVTKLIAGQVAFFFVLIVSLGALVYTYQRNVLMEHFVNNSKTLVETYAAACADAKINKDDLQLLTYIERMKKLPDFVQAMVIGPDYKVQMHTQQSEIGKVLQSDPIAFNVVNSVDKFTMQTYKAVGGVNYAFSMPILVDMKKVAFIRIDFSSQTIGSVMDNYREKAVLAVILMLMLVAIGVYAVSLSFGKGISELKTLSDIIATEKFDELSSQHVVSRTDEIGDLARVLASTLKVVKSNYASYKDKLTYTQTRFNDFLRAIGKYFTKGVLFLDQDNKIIYINSAACAILVTSPEGNICKHILEINRNAELMEALSASSTKPNQMVNMELGSLKTSVAVTTVQEETTNEIIGTIIVFY